MKQRGKKMLAIAVTVSMTLSPVSTPAVLAGDNLGMEQLVGLGAEPGNTAGTQRKTVNEGSDEKQTETQSSADSEKQTEAQSSADSEKQTEAQSGTASEKQTEMQSDAASEKQTENSISDGTQTEISSDAVSETQTETDSTAVSEKQAESETGSSESETVQEEPVAEAQSQMLKMGAGVKTEPETESETEPDYTDGEYKINIESGYKMFKIESQSAEVKNGKIYVTLITGSKSYDRIYLGAKEDADEKKNAEMIQGIKRTDAEGYKFQFELSRSYMGQKVNFVPGKPDGTWYSKNQYQLTIPAMLDYNDGDYELQIESGYKMFKIESQSAEVKNGKIYVTLITGSKSYDKIYLGSKEDSEEEKTAGAIQGTKRADADGYSFQFELSRSYMGQKVNFVPGKPDGTWYSKNQYQLTIPKSMTKKKTESGTETEPSSDTEPETQTETQTETKTEVGTLQNGDYRVTVTSSASMFRVVDCILTYKNGTMTAKITLSGTGYDKLYMGNAAAASESADGAKIGYTTDAEGRYVFDVPVAKLDTQILVAAHSKKNDTWYDRTLVFQSAGMKMLGESGGAGSAGGTETESGTGTETGKETEKETEKKENKKPDKESSYDSDLSGGTGRVDSSTSLADGVYAPDSFSWSGGSGRTSITCSKVTVTGGQAYATIVFGSSTYGYVKANGNKYYPSHSGNTSSFTIPVRLNANNKIIGMTTAMSAAHEITYTIYIYIAGADEKSTASGTTTDKNKLSEEAPEILGLTYQNETKMDAAEYVKIYHYDQGITMIEVDAATGIDRPEEAETEEEVEAETSEDTKAETEAEAETKDAITETAELYQNQVIRYLLVPEGVEVPVGLEKDMILVHTPVQSVYTDSAKAKEWMKQLEKEELITEEGEEPAEKPDYKQLIVKQCDLAILDAEILCRKEKEERSIEEQMAYFTEVTERLTTLEIPVFLDRSRDEKTEQAAAEWIRVYRELFGCTEE